MRKMRSFGLLAVAVATLTPGAALLAQGTAPAGRAPEQPSAAASASSGERANAAQPTPIPTSQPLGSFPTNERTNVPAWVPEGGEESVRKVVGALQRTLTDLQALQLQTKQAHWNVVGTLFYPLHELLQDHYEAIAKHADSVAERLLAVGVSSDGRASTIVRGSTLPEIPGGYLDDAQVIRWFIYAYKGVGEALQQSIKDTEDADPTTSNLLQEVKHDIDKYQWQMRAHFQRAGGATNDGRDLNNGQAVELPAAPAGQGAR